MNEATAQFAPCSQSGVCIFGGDSGRFLDRSTSGGMPTLNIFGWGGVDSATTSSASTAAAGAKIVGNGAVLGHIPIFGSIGSRTGPVVRRVRTLLARGDV